MIKPLHNMDRRNLLEVCEDLIDEKWQRYFTAAALVDEVVAKAHDVELKMVLNGTKKDFDPYGASKRSIRHRIIPVLKMLEKRGEIEKYSKYTWMKVKAVG